ncbi:MAG: hypothetical protein CM1200mP14_19850 [Gammaproteobacteria bacterium]|nr:MAG: hypothetical protein CM1200mP14_19850 [Gammaproteobacteria bacterium]
MGVRGVEKSRQRNLISQSILFFAKLGIRTVTPPPFSCPQEVQNEFFQYSGNPDRGCALILFWHQVCLGVFCSAWLFKHILDGIDHLLFFLLSCSAISEFFGHSFPIIPVPLRRGDS